MKVLCPFLAFRALVVSILTISSGLSAAPANPSTEGKHRVMQGPMVGAVTPTEVILWFRLSGPQSLVVTYALQPDASHWETSADMTARAEDDFTMELPLRNLRPDTTYYYTYRIDGRLASRPPQTFKTAPAGPSRFTVAFGSCAKHEEDGVQAIWHHVFAQQPDLFFWLGDNIYADTLHPHLFHEEYRRQRDVPALQSVLRSIPNLAIWDDHDFGLNDGDRTNPARTEALAAFRRYWANPAYGLPHTPGVFFKYSYGGVDFFFLDIRYHRDPNLEPDTPQKTMLGSGQLAWLLRELKASRAVFKVLISGSGWTQFKGPGGDAWSSYLHERNRLFDSVRDQGITGVFLMSGDTHRGEANIIPRSNVGGYDLAEFVASPIAQTISTELRQAPPEYGVRLPYARALNFGLLRFDLTPADPTVTFELVNAFGDRAYQPVRLRASQLRNGSNYGPSLADDQARAYYQIP
jgi:alkaline phosphatase D